MDLMDNEENQIFLFGAVGFDFDEISLSEELAKLNSSKPLKIFLNSTGGSVFSGLACKTLIENYKGRVHIVIAGLAASAATIISAAKNAHVSMAKGALFMIHNPSCFACGDSNDLKQTAEVLEKTKSQIIEIYQKRASLSAEELKDLMDRESWLADKEALSYGFVDEIDEDLEVKTTVANDEATISHMGNQLVMSLKTEKPTNINEQDARKFLKLSSLSNKQSNLNQIANKGNDMPINDINKQELANTAKQKVAFQDNLSFDELKNELANKYNGFYEQIVNDAKTQELNRIKSLDEYASLVSAEVLNKAKYEDKVSVEQFAMDYLKLQKAQAKEQAEQVQANKVNYLQAAENSAHDFAQIDNSSRAEEGEVLSKYEQMFYNSLARDKKDKEERGND